MHLLPRFRRSAAAGLASLVLLLPGARAQNYGAPAPGGDETEFKKDEKPERPARKHAGWLTRTARETPAEQLAYAQQLEAAGHLRDAADQYDALVRRWHQSVEAATAQMAYAGVLEQRHKDLKAFDEYQYLVDEFAGQFPFDDVMERQYRIATRVSSARHGRVFGLFTGYTTPGRAAPLFEKLALNASHGARAAEVRYTVGRLYEEDGEYELAAQAFEGTVADYPDSPYAPRASFGRAQARYKLSDASPRDEVACREALSALNLFLRDYPSDEQAEAAATRRDEVKLRLSRMYYDRAVFYDKLAHKPKAALINYGEFIKQFPTSPQAEAVTQRMAELEALVAAEKPPP